MMLMLVLRPILVLTDNVPVPTLRPVAHSTNAMTKESVTQLPEHVLIPSKLTEPSVMITTFVAQTIHAK